MGAIKDTFDLVFRDYNTDGIQASGDNEPSKPNIRSIGSIIEAAIAAAGVAGLADVAFATKADMDADLAHDEGTRALVSADGDSDNNDVWIKTGASGVGGWDLSGVNGFIHDSVAALVQPSIDVVSGEVADVVDQLIRARNIAFDPTGAKPVAASSWNAGGTVAWKAGPNAALTGRGVANAIDIGTGAGVTYIWNGQNVPARPNGRYVFRSLYVYSADGATWPASTANSLVAYTLPTSGGALVTGLTETDRGYVQVTANLRRYWASAKLPDTGAIGRVLHGFNALPSGAVVEMGGFTFAVSDSKLTIANVGIDDWDGYSTRDSWRTGVDDLAARAVVSYAYGNALDNGAGDLALGDFIGGGGTLNPVSPTSTVQVAKGVLRAVRAGTADIGFWYFNDRTALDASAAAQYWFASTYVYSPDGAHWVTPQVAFYAAATQVGGTVSLASFVAIDDNNRLYYGSGQIADHDTLDLLKMGTATASLPVENEVGGFQFIRADTPLTLDNTGRDDWYYKRTRPSVVAATVERGRPDHLSGAIVAFAGDSVIQQFNIPSLLGSELACTTHNFGLAGRTLAKTGAESGLNAELDKLSGVALAESIASGDWSVPIAAAEAAWTTYEYTAHDYRAQIAAMAAFDWSTATLLPVFYGTNDWAAEIPLGDADSTDPTTIGGAINEYVRLVQTAHPEVRIVFGAPMWRMDGVGPGDSNDNANGAGLTMQELQDAFVARCRYFQLPCWKPWEQIGFNEFNYGQSEDNGDSTYSTDSLHPSTAKSQARYVSCVSAWLRSVI